jgi:hypothetical protein
MRNAAGRQRVLQRGRHVLLARDLSEATRPPLAIEDLVLSPSKDLAQLLPPPRAPLPGGRPCPPPSILEHAVSGGNGGVCRHYTTIRATPQRHRPFSAACTKGQVPSPPPNAYAVRARPRDLAAAAVRKGPLMNRQCIRVGTGKLLHWRAGQRFTAKGANHT